MLAPVRPEVVRDPTLSRSTAKECPSCGHRGAVYFMAHDVSASGMSLIHVCLSCRHKWVE